MEKKYFFLTNPVQKYRGFIVLHFGTRTMREPPPILAKHVLHTRLGLKIDIKQQFFYSAILFVTGITQ